MKLSEIIDDMTCFVEKTFFLNSENELKELIKDFIDSPGEVDYSLSFPLKNGSEAFIELHSVSKVHEKLLRIIVDDDNKQDFAINSVEQCIEIIEKHFTV